MKDLHLTIHRNGGNGTRKSLAMRRNLGSLLEQITNKFANQNKEVKWKHKKNFR